MKKHVYIFETRSDQIQQHFKLGCILTKRIPEMKCDNMARLKSTLIMTRLKNRLKMAKLKNTLKRARLDKHPDFIFSIAWNCDLDWDFLEHCKPWWDLLLHDENFNKWFLFYILRKSSSKVSSSFLRGTHFLFWREADGTFDTPTTMSSIGEHSSRLVFLYFCIFAFL